MPPKIQESPDSLLLNGKQDKKVRIQATLIEWGNKNMNIEPYSFTDFKKEVIMFSDTVMKNKQDGEEEE